MKKIMLFITALAVMQVLNAQKLVNFNVKNLKEANQKIREIHQNVNPLFAPNFAKATAYFTDTVNRYTSSNGSDWVIDIDFYFYRFNQYGIATYISLYSYDSNDTVAKAYMDADQKFWDFYQNNYYQNPDYFAWYLTKFEEYDKINGDYKLTFMYKAKIIPPNNDYYSWYIYKSFDYNINGDITSGYYDSTSVNENNFVKEYYSYNYDTNLDIWENDEKEEYTTNDDGYITQDISYSWDNTSSSWTKNYKGKYTYNNDNVKIASTYYSWDDSNSEWIPNSRDTIFLNNDGLITQHIYQSWSSSDNQFINSYREVYTYNNNNNLITIIRQSWDTGISDWVNYIEYIYDYDNNNNIITETIKYWDNVNNEWVNSWRYQWNYDNDLLLSFTQSNWDNTNMLWIPLDRTLYTYSNSEKTVIDQQWNNTNSSWDNDEKTIYTYDNDKLIKKENYDWNGSEWSNNYKKIYKWREVSTQEDKLKGYSDNIYPNPAINIVFIPYQNAIVDVFNTNGQKIKTIKTNNGKINVSDLDKGIYLIKVYSNSGILTSKLVKE